MDVDASGKRLDIFMPGRLGSVALDGHIEIHTVDVKELISEMVQICAVTRPSGEIVTECFEVPTKLGPIIACRTRCAQPFEIRDSM